MKPTQADGTPWPEGMKAKVTNNTGTYAKEGAIATFTGTWGGSPYWDCERQPNAPKPTDSGTCINRGKLTPISLPDKTDKPRVVPGDKVLVINNGSLHCLDIGSLQKVKKAESNDYLVPKSIKVETDGMILQPQDFLAIGDRVKRGPNMDEAWNKEGMKHSTSLMHPSAIGTVTSFSERAGAVYSSWKGATVTVKWDCGDSYTYRMNATHQDLTLVLEGESEDVTKLGRVENIDTKGEAEPYEPEGKPSCFGTYKCYGQECISCPYDKPSDSCDCAKCWTEEDCRTTFIADKKTKPIQEDTMDKTRKERAGALEVKIVDLKREMEHRQGAHDEQRARETEQIESWTVEMGILNDHKTDHAAIIADIKAVRGPDCTQEQAESILRLKKQGYEL